MSKSITLPHRDIVETLQKLESRGVLKNPKVVKSVLGAAKTVIPPLVAKKTVAQDEKAK